jgi:glutathione S-transferase
MSYYKHPRCKICNSSLRDEVDRLLLGDTLHDDGSRFTYEEIVDWCAAQGLTTSTGALSRHRNNHLQPALAAALETQAVVDAITAATGKKLSLHTALANSVAAKVLRLLNEKSDELDKVALDKLLGWAWRYSEVAGKLERNEAALREDVAKTTSEKLTAKGISAETIKEIEEQILGMR